MTTTRIAGQNVQIQHENDTLSVELTPRAGECPGVSYLDIKVSAATPTRPSPISLVWEQKMVDIHYGAGAQRHWNLGGMGSRRLKASAASQAPAISMFNYAGINRLTLAVADAINTSELIIRHAEETGCITCTLQIFVDPVPPLTGYTTTIRFDTRE